MKEEEHEIRFVSIYLFIYVYIYWIYESISQWVVNIVCIISCNLIILTYLGQWTDMIMQNTNKHWEGQADRQTDRQTDEHRDNCNKWMQKKINNG